MVDRLKEPSTWVGIAVLIQVIAGIEIPPDLFAALSEHIIGIIAAAGAILGILLREKTKP